MIKPFKPNIKTLYTIFRRSVSNVKVSELDSLLIENPNPKSTIVDILNQACVEHQNIKFVQKNVQFNNIQYHNTDGRMRQLWQASLALKWPRELVYQGLGSNKKEAEIQAYLMALKHIKQRQEGHTMVICERLKELMSNASKSPKHVLANIMFSVSNDRNDPDIKLHYEAKKIDDCLWQCDLKFPWPEPLTFTMIGSSKQEAEVLTCDEALTYLSENNYIDKEKQPILVTPVEKRQFYEQRNKPVSLPLGSQLRQEISSLVQHFREIEPKLEVDPSGKELCDESPNIREPLNIFTGAPHRKENAERDEMRNQDLRSQFEYLEFSHDTQVSDTRKARSELPIYNERARILSTIENNQVVLISGGTGCGKTTQIPQFILEEFALKDKGTDCNIVVTQPRRISAMAISEHIASAMGEKLGESVGYSIRLQQELPSQKGAILFCSTGILFQHLLSQKELKGISHIIMDEIHERCLYSDSLLNLLKDILPQNPQLKLILMSASINQELFSKYFNDCPVISVPGTTYAVQEYYLPDVLSILDKGRSISSFEVFDKRETELILDLILHIDSKEAPGGILCFLPGWREIQLLMTKLEGLEQPSRFVVCPAHSKLSSEEQLNIFKPPLPGQRKVVLATNIAETSITINDIVYVIDPGLHKELRYDPNSEVSTLLTKWTSKSSAIQRKGRAGRVAAGKCYRLYTPDIWTKMPEYSTPEILRVSLVQLTLESKVFAPNLSIKEFLSKGLETPSEENIDRAIAELQDLKMLTDEEMLTPLGKCISRLQMHPRLSKALVYSIFFNCLSPFLNLSACLSTNKDIFQTTLSNKSSIKESLKQISNSESSDHLALVSLFEAWQEAEDKPSFCEQMNMNPHSLEFIEGLREMFLNTIHSLNLIQNESCHYNANASDTNLVLAVLACAFYPQIIKMHHGGIKNHKINTNKIVLLSLKGKVSDLSKESLLSGIKNFQSPWLAYFSGLNLDDRKRLLVSHASMIPPLSLLLLTEEPLVILQNESGVDIQVKEHKHLTFHFTSEDAKLVQDTKSIFEKCIAHFIHTMGSEDVEQDVEEFREHLLQVLKHLFNSNLDSSSTNNDQS